MKYSIVFISLFLFSCGGDDVLNPVYKEPVSTDIPGVITEIPVGEPEEKPPAEEEEPACPEEYAIADMVVLSCQDDGTALIAIGSGCIKSLQLLEGEEAEEWCL